MNIFKTFSVYANSLVRYNSATKMKINKITPVIACEEESSYMKATEYLRSGEVIAVPTDTIYGLACSANCQSSIQKLYAIKGRDSAKPVAICVSSIPDVRKWGEADHLSDSLLKTLLPGPVTVVLKKTQYLDNPYLNPMTTKIGIRIPNHDFINKVTKIFDMPMALTSANSSNEPSSLTVKEFEHLFGYLGAVFNGGTLSQGLDKCRSGSTVVDLSRRGQYEIIRKGISYDEIINTLHKHGLSCILK